MNKRQQIKIIIKSYKISYNLQFFMSSPNISTVYYHEEPYQINEGNKRYLTQLNGFEGQSNIEPHLRYATINQGYTNQQFQYTANQNYQTQVVGTRTLPPVQNFQQSTTLGGTNQVYVKPVQTIQTNNIQMISRPVTVTNQVANIQPVQRLATVSQQSIPISAIVQPTVQRRIVEQVRIPTTASVVVPRVATANTTVINQQPQYISSIIKYQYQQQPMVQTTARSAWQSYYEPKKVVQYQAPPPPAAPEKGGCCSPWIFALLGLLALIGLILGIIFASKANMGFGSPVSNISNTQGLNSNSAASQQSLYSNYTITVQTTVVNTSSSSSTNLNSTSSSSSTSSLNSSTSSNTNSTLSSSTNYNTIYQKTNSTVNNNINNTNTFTNGNSNSNSNTNINNTNSVFPSSTSTNNINNKLLLSSGQAVTFSNQNTRNLQTSTVTQPNLTNINQTKLSTPTTYSTNKFNTLNVNPIPVPNINYETTATKQTQTNNLYSPYEINVQPIPATVNTANYQNNAYVPSTTTFNQQYTVNVQPTVHNPVPASNLPNKVITTSSIQPTLTAGITTNQAVKTKPTSNYTSVTINQSNVTNKTQYYPTNQSAQKSSNYTSPTSTAQSNLFSTIQPSANSTTSTSTTPKTQWIFSANAPKSNTSTGTSNQTTYVTNDIANSSTLTNISQTNSNLNQVRIPQTTYNSSTQINQNSAINKTIGISNETASFIPSAWSFIFSNKTQNRIQPNTTSITKTQNILNQTSNATVKSTTTSNISLASSTNTSRLTQIYSKIQTNSTLNNTNQSVTKNQSMINQNSTITGLPLNSTTNTQESTKILPINQTIIPTTTPTPTPTTTPTTTPGSTGRTTTYTPPSQPIFGQINAFSAIRTLTNQTITQRHQLRINNQKLI